MERPIVAYYFSIVGGSFEVITGIVTAFQPRFYYPYNIFYQNGGESVFYSPLTALPGLAVLYLSRRFLATSKELRVLALGVIVMSIVSLFGILGSGVFLIEGLLLPGPFLSFTGGVLGLLWRPTVVESTI